MSHKKCQGFEQRVNEIMDLRLDPIEDQQLRDHALVCTECNDLLQSFAELHVGLSGPNKIPIALLASESGEFDKSGASVYFPRSGIAIRWLACVGSLAALLLIGLTIVIAGLDSHSPSQVASSNKIEARLLRSTGSLGLTSQKSLTGDSGAQPTTAPQIPPVSLRQISDGLRSLPVYQYSGDLPGFRPFQSSLDLCIDWFQNSLFNFSGDRRPPSTDPPATNENSGFGFQLISRWDARLA